MGWTGEGIRALKEMRKVQIEEKAKKPRHHICEDEQDQREQLQGTPADPPEDALHQPMRLWHAVGISVAVIGLLVVMMDQMADHRNARRAEQAKLAVQRAEQQAAEHKEAAAQQVQEEAEFGSVLTAGQ